MTTETPQPPLTDAEHHALALTNGLANLLHQIAGDAGDFSEMVLHIHGIQHAIMAQAAARAYPMLYRLLGEDAFAVEHINDTAGGGPDER